MNSRRYLIGTWLLLTLASCVRPASVPSPASSGIAENDVEQGIVSRVNAERVSARKPSLTRNANLDALARTLASRMAAEGRLTHAGFQSRFERAHAETGAILFGENAHSVPLGGDPAKRLVEEWLASRIHHNNILNGSWNLTGVGTSADKSGRIWAAQVFAMAP